MKNWEPLVFDPEFAIDRSPGLVCLRRKFSSAFQSISSMDFFLRERKAETLIPLNLFPYIDLPPVPFPLVKSPPWTINMGITRWKLDPAYPKPFWPVQSSRKLRAVKGTTSSYNLKTIRPAGLPPIVISNCDQRNQHLY